MECNRLPDQIFRGKSDTAEHTPYGFRFFHTNGLLFLCNVRK